MFEFLTLAAILEFGTVFFYGFWVVILLLALVESTLVESEKFGFAFIMTLILSCFFGWRFHFEEVLQHNPAILWKFLGIYVTIGVMWMFAKWIVMIRRHKRRAESRLIKYKEDRGIKDRLLRESEIRDAFAYDQNLGEPPLAKNNKGKLVNWAYLWPFSVIGTIAGDWLREFFVWIYNRLGAVLDRVSKLVWGGKLKV